MTLTIGDGHECGKQTIVIQADVKFNRSLGGAKPDPGKHAQTQIDGGYVE